MIDNNILGNLGAADFLREYWQKKPVLIRQALPDFVSPLDADGLAGLACEDDVESRLIRKQGDKWSLQSGPFDAEILSALPERDWTLLVQDVEKHLPDLAETIDLFSFIPQWRIDDLMISIAARGGGVGPHVDAYDVFLLQAKGRRRWSIAEQFDPAIIEGMELRVLKHFAAEQEWTLEPGDMLYLPPNVAHDGFALDDDCMTWSIGFRAPALKDMFSDFTEWLYQRLPDDIMYTDADLDAGEAAGGRISAAGLRRAGRLLRTALQVEDNDMDRWFGEFITEPKPWLRCEPAAHTITAATLQNRLANDDVLLKDSRARLSWAELAGGFVLFVDGASWDMNADKALLAMLCSRRRFSRADLEPHLDDRGVELLRRLHEHGALYFLSETDEEPGHGE